MGMGAISETDHGSQENPPSRGGGRVVRKGLQSLTSTDRVFPKSWESGNVASGTGCKAEGLVVQHPLTSCFESTMILALPLSRLFYRTGH